MTALIWFRKDCRIHDNPALTQACKAGDVQAVYIDAIDQHKAHQQSPIQRDFISRNLQCLAEQLAELGIALTLLEVSMFKDIPQVLIDYCQQHAIEHVYANRETGVHEQQRDQAVQQALDIPFTTYLGQCIIPEGLLSTGKGDMFKVFTPFSRAWLKQLQLAGYNLFPAPDAIGPAIKANTLSLKPFDTVTSSQHYPAGETEAQKRLAAFCKQKLFDYDADRDFPAIDGSSQLSHYLAIGVLTANQCLAAIVSQLGHMPASKGEPGFCWLNELIWRDFYHHLMYAYPRLSMHRAFKPETEKLRWNTDQEVFQRWCQGQTGFPIIDAAMRCLNQTGWMHNRLRMVTASFLCKDLHLDWRWGENYFMSQLIDGELAANNGGWQWAAGTGADAAPYFRVFNPTTQGQRFDPDGSFVKTWVPELADVPLKKVHTPHDWLNENQANHNYPNPVIDHRIAREVAIKMFADLKTA